MTDDSEDSPALPDPAVLPSPGRARYLLIVVVLMLAGSYATRMVYDQVSQQSRKAAYTRCFAEASEAIPGDGLPAMARSLAVMDCVAPVEHRRAFVELGGAALILVMGLILMWLLPYRLLRRAGPFRPAATDWLERVQVTARELGLRRVPAVAFGPARLREPFTVGGVRGARVVLPPAVKVLPPAQADAVIRHEVAHVAAGDVTLVWLTRGAWWALPPVLLLPAAVSVVREWPSAGTAAFAALADGFWLEYSARAGLLLVVAVLVSLLVLRSREHEADLRSVQGRSIDALRHLFEQQAPRRQPWWRRAVQTHPSPARRRAALQHPELTMHLHTVTAAATGLLAAMTVPAVETIASSGLMATHLAPYISLVAGILAGSMLAVAWGIAVWRSVLVGERGGAQPRLWGALLGLPLGMALGLAVELSGTGTGVPSSLGGWPSLVVTTVVTAGAAGISVGLARLWARWRIAITPDARPRWMAAFVVNALVFTGALWIGPGTGLLIGVAGEAAGHDGTAPADWRAGYVLGGLFSNWLTPAAVSTAAIAFLAWWWAIRSGRTAGPGRGSSTWSLLWLSVAAAGIAVAVRWAITAGLEEGNDSYTAQLDWWAASAAGVACLLTVLLFTGVAGLGRAVAASTLSTAMVAAAIWIRFLPDWTDPLAAAKVYAVRPLALLCLTLLIVGLPAALLPARIPRPGRKRSWTSPVLAALLAGAMVAGILHAGDSILVAL